MYLFFPLLFRSFFVIAYIWISLCFRCLCLVGGQNSINLTARTPTWTHENNLSCKPMNLIHTFAFITIPQKALPNFSSSIGNLLYTV